VPTYTRRVPHRPFAAPGIVSTLLVVATALGALSLASSEFHESSALLLAAGMVLVTLISVAGLLLARARWSVRACAAVAICWIGIGTFVASPIAFAAAAAAAGALAGAAGPWMRAWARHTSSVDGPPPMAVVALLLLVSTPIALAVGFPGGIAASHWVFAGWALSLAFALSRAFTGSLTMLRIVHPLAAVALLVVEGMGALPATVLGIAAGALGWLPDVAASVTQPPPEAVAIPPELAPSEVLDAAGIDESGRRRGAT
jgi:hypothetical protein